MNTRAIKGNKRTAYRGRAYFSLGLISHSSRDTRSQFYLFNLSNYSMTKRNEIMNELSSGATKRSMLP